MSFSYIHDPDFEADFIENDYEEEQMTFGERLSILNEQYMKINNMEENYVRALIRDLLDLHEDAEQENDLFYMRESIYLVCKSSVTPVGIECLRKDKDLYGTCMWRAETSLEFIDNIYENDMDEKYNVWGNTANTIIDFLNITYNM